MNLIINTALSYFSQGRKVKSTPSGWLSANAVCCIYNSNSQDTRSRGGMYVLNDSISYHCFNCGFKTGWQQGNPLSFKFKNLLRWLNVPDDIITKCSFDALRLKDEVAPEYKLDLVPKFFEKALPMGSKPIKEWINDPPGALLPVLEYLLNRGYSIDDYNWHWTDEKGFDDRLIVPFYYQGRTVGYTARLCKERKTVKYISEQQPGYVFNLDNQNANRKSVIVTEGPLDAICIDGVAVTSNNISSQQKFLISSLNKKIIVMPDRDKASIGLIEQAIEWGWSVSFPDWEQGIKDINDAVKKYGKIYTLWNIIQSKETTPLKIQLRMKKWI